MELKEQLNEDLKAAMRAKDETRVSAIRMLKAAISNFELARAKDAQPPTEADYLGVVEKQIKQRRESIELYKQGNRPELAAKEEQEIAALQGYLPSSRAMKSRPRCRASSLRLARKSFPK